MQHHRKYICRSGIEEPIRVFTMTGTGQRTGNMLFFCLIATLIRQNVVEIYPGMKRASINDDGSINNFVMLNKTGILKTTTTLFNRKNGVCPTDITGTTGFGLIVGI
jgi:hypothetical protein